ncbi:MAG: RNA 2',3'-cyclic phosphodiesterase [Acidimicrobiia bacterium]
MVEPIGRIFVAVGFPPEVRMAIVSQLDQLQLPGTPVPVENLHVTLRFLGEVDSVGFDRLLAALDGATLPGSFHVELGGLGTFPKPRQATVLWLAVTTGGDALVDLQLAVEDGCEEAGLGREERPFRPHVTVSWIRPPADVRPVVAALPSLGLRSAVDEIVVLRSHLGAGAPRYELLERFPL